LSEAINPVWNSTTGSPGFSNSPLIEREIGKSNHSAEE
jgi:hypothetical protein